MRNLACPTCGSPTVLPETGAWICTNPACRQSIPIPMKKTAYQSRITLVSKDVILSTFGIRELANQAHSDGGLFLNSPQSPAKLTWVPVYSIVRIDQYE